MDRFGVAQVETSGDSVGVGLLRQRDSARAAVPGDLDTQELVDRPQVSDGMTRIDLALIVLEDCS